MSTTVQDLHLSCARPPDPAVGDGATLNNRRDLELHETSVNGPCDVPNPDLIDSAGLQGHDPEEGQTQEVTTLSHVSAWTDGAPLDGSGDGNSSHSRPETEAPSGPPAAIIAVDTDGVPEEVDTDGGTPEDDAGEAPGDNGGRPVEESPCSSFQPEELAIEPLELTIESTKKIPALAQENTKRSRARGRGANTAGELATKTSRGGRAANSKGLKGRDSSRVGEDQVVVSLVLQIQAKQQAVFQVEGEGIASQVDIGIKLEELKKLSGRTWGKCLGTFGYSPRVASRLLKLGKAWGPGFRHNASDLLPNLPSDLNKLEWLCRLDIDQLRELLSRIDTRRSGRKEIIAKVRATLQEEPPSRKVDARSLVGSIEKTFDRLNKAIGRIRGEAVDFEQAQRAREAMAAGLSRLQASLDLAEEGGPVA